MLEKKEKVLLKKVATEVEKAKEFTRAKNKRGMLLLSIIHLHYTSYGIHLCASDIVCITFSDTRFHN